VLCKEFYTINNSVISKILENMAIANALQLEAAQAMPALSHFNYDAMPRLKSLNLSIAIL